MSKLITVQFCFLLFKSSLSKTGDQIFLDSFDKQDWFMHKNLIMENKTTQGVFGHIIFLFVNIKTDYTRKLVKF